MAFWQRTKNGRIKIYTSVNGRQRQLPKSLYAHLDHEPDHNVEAWIRQYEEQYERKQRAPEQEIDPALRRHVEGYLIYIGSRGKAGKTVGDHRRMLHQFILPYFVGTCALPDPNDWPRMAPQFSAWMRERGESEHQILRANSAVRGFWEYLCDERLILSGVQIRVRAPILRAAPTPLKRTVTPDEVLNFVRRTPERPIKLMALLGYFFSLRPQETFALRKQDFMAGSRASVLECSRVMAKAGLYDKLAVDIHRQRTQTGEFGPPKAYSVGTVACFNEQPARILVEILRQIEDPSALLFEFLPDWNFELWSRHGLGSDIGRQPAPLPSDISLKDLRRASLYWLGHYSNMELVQLKNHARHKKVDTTMLYMRRPGETVGEFQELDLDA
jgi:hypothetical protein